MLSIIVPFRDRDEHLKKFIPHITSFLKNINFKISIIEQIDNKPFNRAKLLNVGFDLSKDESSYFCFHDIDMLPASLECDYSFFKGVCKLSYFVSQFNFVPRPETELGGVTLIDKDSFIETNGYCNNYWGWGVEDNDFALRCAIKKIPFAVRKGKYFSLSHKPNGDTYGGAVSDNTKKNREYFENVKNNYKELFSNGISSLQYSLEEKKEYTNYSVYRVKI